MSDNANILIFPSGSESAMNIYDALKYYTQFNVFGASSQSDHAEFVFPKSQLYIGDLYIYEASFIDKFNEVIKTFEITHVIPTHDIIASFLSKYGDSINATIISSPYDTARIAENKRLTYEALKGKAFYPIVYETVEEIIEYPVFIKPYIGVGSRGAVKVKNQESLLKLLEKDSEVLISEFLPGEEITVECFTDRKGDLLISEPRSRDRISNGITYRTKRAKKYEEVDDIAKALNKCFVFRGAWYFQVKKSIEGHFKLLEISVRESGTMSFYRQLGINFSALSVLDAMNYDLQILFNDYNLVLDKRVQSHYQLNYDYHTLYIDPDETLVVKNKVNTSLIKVIYQQKNKHKKIVLLTRNMELLKTWFKKYGLCEEIFDEIITIENQEQLLNCIKYKQAVFVSSHFEDRLQVMKVCEIPVFNTDAVECLIDTRAY